MFSWESRSLNSSDQQDPVNLTSRPSIICWGTHQYITTNLKNKQVVSLAVQYFEYGMKVAYLENLSITTKILEKSSIFRRFVMKSSDILFHEQAKIKSSSNYLGDFFLSTLSSLQTRQVQV